MKNLKPIKFFFYVWILFGFSLWVWEWPLFYRLKNTLGHQIVCAHDEQDFLKSSNNLNTTLLPNNQYITSSDIPNFVYEPVGIMWSHHFTVKYSDGVIKSYRYIERTLPCEFFIGMYFTFKSKMGEKIGEIFPWNEKDKTHLLLSANDEKILDFIRAKIQENEVPSAYQYPWISSPGSRTECNIVPPKYLRHEIRKFHALS